MHTRLRLSKKTISLIIGVIGIAGLLSLSLFLQHERSRDTQQWREKLNIIADAKAHDLNAWVQSYFGELTNLAANPSLQIYFAAVQQPPSMMTTHDTSAQAEYLRNLLSMASQRLNLQPSSLTPQQQFRASVRVQGSGGLALLRNDGTVVMNTDNMPSMTSDLAGKLAAVPRGKAQFVDITQDASGAQRVAFVVPVYGVQQEQTAAGQIGRLVGVRLLDGQFFSLISPQPAHEKTLEVALVRAEKNQSRYLTPLLDQSPLMSRAEGNTDTSAAAFALTHPNEFGERKDYRGNRVLLTSRQITSTPWTMAAKIDRSEALAQTAAWRTTLAVTIILLLGALIATVIAIWLYGEARNQAELVIEMGNRKQEITNTLYERELRVTTLNQLVTMLVSLADKRDPHAAKHSARVAELAKAIARNMNLDSNVIDTTTTAAQLMNLGKADLPPGLLTQSGTLNESDRATIRSSVAMTADLLSGIAFNGPVADTLRQSQEWVNGSGPQRMRGESILVSARIIALANALIGMISARSYRPAMSLEEALNVLQQEIDKRFDREVFRALLNYLDQQGGRKWLKQEAASMPQSQQAAV